VVDRSVPLPPFAVTYDYRCPFARIVHDHLVTALQTDAAADWDVTFVPLSLSQLKVEPGGVPVWDAPETDSGLLALELGIAVRETQPERFLDAHRALFELRHGRGGNLRDEAQLRQALTEAGVDADAAFAEVATGIPRKLVQEAHERAVAEHDVWGVPTFIAGDSAVFVRLMDRPTDEADAVRSIERLVDLLSWTGLNEFKHTTLSR
jgi:DSBA-like thioredoxin domain